LGFGEPTIRQLETRGHLDRLALTQPEIRARLYRAHLAHLRAHAGEPNENGMALLREQALLIAFRES
jgi:hypothetical protein